LAQADSPVRRADWRLHRQEPHRFRIPKLYQPRHVVEYGFRSGCHVATDDEQMPISKICNLMVMPRLNEWTCVGPRIRCWIPYLADTVGRVFLVRVWSSGRPTNHKEATVR